MLHFNCNKLKCAIFKMRYILFDYRIAANCRKMLDSGRVTEHDGEMYCGACYRKLFGPKGYGFGSLNMDDGKGYTVSAYCS